MEQLFIRLTSLAAILLGGLSVILWASKDVPMRRKIIMIILSAIVVIGATLTLWQNLTHLSLIFQEGLPDWITRFI